MTGDRTDGTWGGEQEQRLTDLEARAEDLLERAEGIKHELRRDHADAMTQLAERGWPWAAKAIAITVTAMADGWAPPGTLERLVSAKVEDRARAEAFVDWLSPHRPAP